MDIKNDDGIPIKTEGLTKKFGRVTAVDSLQLRINKEEVFCLLGPNGAGKTTIIQLLCSLVRPDAGSICIFGMDPVKQAEKVKQCIALSPQESAIAPLLSVQENVMLMAGLYGQEKERALSATEELLERMQLSPRRKDKAGTLSGGMQRKLSIAMALITEPRVLFLDEPTTGLDPYARRDLWNLIRSIRKKTTVILTTHYLDEADALADRIGFIKSGRLIAVNTPSVLKQQFGDPALADSLEQVFFTLAERKEQI